MINRERIPRDVIVVGGSAGGIEAVTGLLGALPATGIVPLPGRSIATVVWSVAKKT